MRIAPLAVLAGSSLLMVPAQLMAGFPQQQADTPTAQTSPQGTQHPTSKPAAQPSKPIKYVNTKYGFTFSLPATWKGYKIVEGSWDGGDNNGPHGYEVVERGPAITLVNPQSTSTQPFQDIYIMVFSHAQWDSLQQEKFFVSAAPIGPGELGRNRKYVFAAPPRMINDSLYGYEEVVKIMQSNPLHPF
jgi:bla regulator protein blaR1